MQVGYVSVLEKHGREIAMAEAMGKKIGRLHFAVCVLSDVQEMVRFGEEPEKINEEINEAKELILSVIDELEKEKYMP